MPRNLNRVIGQSVPFVETMPAPIVAQRAPAVTDDNFAQGQAWIDESPATNVVYVHLGGGNWDAGGNQQATTTVQGIVELATTAETTTGTDAERAVTPLGLNAVVLAGATDATTASRGIIEISTTAEATAGVDTERAVTPANVASILAAPGAIGGGTPAAGSFTTLTASSTVTFTGGVLNLGTDDAANAVNLAVGTTARDVNIANSAAAHAVGIGSTTGAAEIVLSVGTGNFVLDGVTGSTYTIGAATTTGTFAIGGTSQTGTFTLAGSDGAMTLNVANANGAKVINIGSGVTGNTISVGNGANSSAQIVNVAAGASAANSTVNVLSGNGSAGAQTFNCMSGTRAGVVNISTGAAAHVTTIGTVSGAASLDLLVGTGDFTLEGNVASTYALSATGANTGTFTIAAGTGARVVNLATGGTGVKTLNIATGAIGNIVTIGTVTAAASLDLLVGTGNFTLEGNVASTYSISATGVNTGTVTIAAGTGARIVNIATGGTGAKTVNIATDASADVVSIGTVTGAASLDLRCGTGDFTLEGNVASTYDISATGANTGTFTLAAGTGARTVNLATGGTGVKTVNLATGAIGNIVTIGTVSAAASLDLLVGTGNFTLEGNVASTYAISATGANTGTVTIAAGTGARTVNLATGGTGIKTVNLATGAIGNIVTIGTISAAASLDLLVGTGNFTLDGVAGSTYTIGASTTTGTITIGGTAQTGTMTLGDSSGTNIVQIGSGEGATTVNIAGGATSAKVVNISTGAIAGTITIGNVTGATSIALNAGTGGIALASTGAGDITINSDDTLLLDSDGVLELNSSAGEISIANDAVSLTCNFATGAADMTTNLGSANTSSTTVLQSGTGGLSLEAAGAVSMVPSTASVAGVSLTLNARVGVATFTGQTTGAGSNVDLVITNSLLGAGDGIFCTVSNRGSNDADITLEGCITETAGTLTLRCQNNGAAALNGDIVATFWIIN